MKEFEKIAQEYIESFGEVMPGFKYRIGENKEYVSKHYYDFVFVTLEGKIPKEPPIAGGACGFTVDKKTRKIEMLSFGDLGLLEQHEEELNEVYSRLTEIKNDSKSLNWLKSKYNLTSRELLKIKKVLSATELGRARVLEETEEIIKINR